MVGWQFQTWGVVAAALFVGAAGCNDCGGTRVNPVRTELAAPLQLEFAPTVVGTTSTRRLVIENVGAALAHVQFTTDSAAFGLAAVGPVVIAPRGSVSLDVWYMPDTVADHVGTLRAEGDFGAPVVVRLVGRGRAVPDCDDENACTVNVFDFGTAACVAIPREGPCGSEAACIVDGECVEGVCIGDAPQCPTSADCFSSECIVGVGCTESARAGACDDGDVCTDDVCTAGGCQNPLSAEGTQCGDIVQCVTHPVCVQGACTDIGWTDGTPCDDGDACTTDDVCQSETCGGVGTDSVPAVGKAAVSTMGHWELLSANRVLLRYTPHGPLAGFLWISAESGGIRLAVLERTEEDWSVIALRNITVPPAARATVVDDNTIAYSWMTADGNALTIAQFALVGTSADVTLSCACPAGVTSACQLEAMTTKRALLSNANEQAVCDLSTGETTPFAPVLPVHPTHERVAVFRGAGHDAAMKVVSTARQHVPGSSVNFVPFGRPVVWLEDFLDSGMASALAPRALYDPIIVVDDAVTYVERDSGRVARRDRSGALTAEWVASHEQALLAITPRHVIAYDPSNDMGGPTTSPQVDDLHAVDLETGQIRTIDWGIRVDRAYNGEPLKVHGAVSTSAGSQLLMHSYGARVVVNEELDGGVVHMRAGGLVYTRLGGASPDGRLLWAVSGRAERQLGPLADRLRHVGPILPYSDTPPDYRAAVYDHAEGRSVWPAAAHALEGNLPRYGVIVHYSADGTFEHLSGIMPSAWRTHRFAQSFLPSTQENLVWEAQQSGAEFVVRAQPLGDVPYGDEDVFAEHEGEQEAYEYQGLMAAGAHAVFITWLPGDETTPRVRTLFYDEGGTHTLGHAEIPAVYNFEEFGWRIENSMGISTDGAVFLLLNGDDEDHRRATFWSASLGALEITHESVLELPSTSLPRVLRVGHGTAVVRRGTALLYLQATPDGGIDVVDELEVGDYVEQLIATPTGDFAVSAGGLRDLTPFCVAPANGP